MKVFHAIFSFSFHSEKSSVETSSRLILYRGAEIYSVNSLEKVEIRVKLEAKKNEEERPPRIDIDKFKDPETKQRYQLELQSRFEVLQDYLRKMKKPHG